MSKTPHMKFKMQNSCPLFSTQRTAWRLAHAVAWCWLALGSAAAASFEHRLQHWVATHHRVALEQVQIQAMDARLQVPTCPGGWQFDHPFTNDATVRARCLAPARQLFTRVHIDGASPQVRAPQADTPQEAAPAATRSVVVLNSLLPRGTRLQAEHLSVVDLPTQGLHPMTLGQMEEALQSELVRDLPEGTPLRSQDIRPALLVRRGHEVSMTWEPTPGFHVSARLEAMQDGRMGETIRLVNRDSGRVITATVTGPSTAQGL